MQSKRVPRSGRTRPALLPEDTARYQGLAQELESQIREGRLKPRARVPSENELARNFGVSRVTVRAALAILERKGLLQRRPGVGTFVASSRLHHDLAALESLFGRIAAQGIPIEPKLTEFRAVEAAPPIAERLGYRDTMLLSRIWNVDGRPFAVVRSHMHPKARTVSHSDAEKYPAFTILEKLLRFRITQAAMKIRAELAGQDVAKALSIKPSDPVLVLERTAYSDTGEAVEYVECHMRAEAIEFDFLAQGGTSLMAAFQRPSDRAS